MSIYNEKSIKELTPRESIRDNLGMYIGNADSDGLHQLFIEAIANSIDEAVGGFGKTIKVSLETATNRLTISDEGRGIPFGKNESGEDALIIATCSLHGGGKFEGQTGYKSSLGLHGLGLKCIHYLSSDFTIASVRDGKECVLSFRGKEDKQIGPTVTSVKKKSGTTITFIPDVEIFGKNKFSASILANRMQTYALLNNNIEFVLDVDGKTTKFLYTDGIRDLLKLKVGDEKLVTQPVFFKTSVSNENGQTAHFQFAIAYTDKGYDREYCYANGGETPNGGTYLTGFKSGYTTLINKLAKASGCDKSFSGEMIRSGLILVMIMKADFRLGFAEQTKLTLNSPEARALASQAIGKLELSEKEFKGILKKIENEQKLADAAARKREAQEKIARGGHNMNAIKDLPIKLADANDFTDAEIFFCEGE